MNRKPPIRTYQRKNAVQNAVSMYGPAVSVTVENEWGSSRAIKTCNDKFKTETDENTSLNYDPFDTTFDRLVKNTKAAPAPVPFEIENYSWLNSSDEVEPRNNSLLHVSIDVSNLNINKVANSNIGAKSSHARELKRKVPKQAIYVHKRRKLLTSVKKNEATQNAVESTKGSFTKLLQVNKKNNKQRKQSMGTLNISISNNNNFQQERTVENRMDGSKADNSTMSISALMKLLDIKACSVKLKDICEDRHKGNVPYIRNDSKSVEDNMLLGNSVELKNHARLTLNYTNSKIASQYKERGIQNCFVKLEKLEPVLNTKDAIDKLKLNAISSTPIHKSRKRAMASLLLSPISSYCNEELDVLKEPLKYRFSNDINKNLMSVKQDDTDISLCEKSNDTMGAKSNETSTSVKGSLIPPESIKNENKDSIVQECSDISKPYSEVMASTENRTSTICTTNPSESLIEDSKADVKCSSHMQNSEYNASDTFSKTHISATQSIIETSVSLVSQSKTESSISLVSQSKIETSVSLVSQSKTEASVSSVSESKIEASVSSVSESKIEASVSSVSESNTEAPVSSVSESKIEASVVSSVAESNTEASVSLVSESKIETSVSLLSQSTANGTSEDNNCAISIDKSSTKSMEDESIDAEDIQDCPVTTPNGNDKSFENLSTGTQYIENVNNQNNSRQMNDNKSNSILGNTSQKEDTNNSFQQLRVVLERLQDPVRITNRRKQYRKWTSAFNRMSGNNSFQKRISDIHESMEENPKDETPTKVEKSIEKSMENVSIPKDDPCVTTECTTKSCFLKPGKSWTRSLSILNNIQNCVDSNACKGKGWRGSVKVVLDMQKQEVCSKQKENDDPRASQVLKPELEECNRKRFTTDVARMTKRVSVRVVQIGEPAKYTDDASFLEAYGIAPRLTNARRSTVSRRTSVNNVECTTNQSTITQDYSELKAKEVVLSRCKQKDFLPFANYFAESYTGHCKKIGEGVYGEVFLHENESKTSVIKIIPIEGSECVNGERQKKFGEILSEIVIAMELHNLRFSSTHWTNSFVDVQSLKCIQGKYPDSLIKLWDLYDDENGSENDSPTIFNEGQLFISLELGHGGQDLEAFIFHTAQEALASFQQTALALAVAENALQFEHRDLHWGNILIARTDEKFAQYKFPDREFNVPTKGVKVSIIDFTLSRMTYESCCIFNDLALDPALFTAQGDYQFEIYRLMKDTVTNEWHKFEPYTNILWLHYTLDKMITAVRYKKKNLKAHKTAISNLKSVKSQILNYQSTYDFVTNCDMFANVQRINL